MTKHKAFSSGRGQMRLLPFLLCLMLFTGCQRKEEKPYSIHDGIRRMNALNTAYTEINHADGFSRGLALPEDGTASAEDITAEACLLVTNGQNEPESIAYKNPFVKTYQASITKIMTALVCLQNKSDLSEEFTITDSSVIHVSGSSTANLRVGETLTIKDLLYGMLMPSGNDAAVAVAEATAGSVEQFVTMMNEEAMRLGCTGTHFINPNGLPDERHYTTPYDIYLILREALKYDAFREIVSSASYTAIYKDSNGVKKTQEWQNTDQYLTGERETPQGLVILGGKTGTTKAAGYCLTIGVQKSSDDSEYIAVVMKADSHDDLYTNMTTLLSKIH